MRTFTYWIAKHRYDSACYSLIGPTKTDVQRQIDELEPRDREFFDAPVQLSFTYNNLFDFFAWVTSESGGRDCGVPVKKES